MGVLALLASEPWHEFIHSDTAAALARDAPIKRALPPRPPLAVS